MFLLSMRERELLLLQRQTDEFEESKLAIAGRVRAAGMYSVDRFRGLAWRLPYGVLGQTSSKLPPCLFPISANLGFLLLSAKQKIRCSTNDMPHHTHLLLANRIKQAQ